MKTKETNWLLQGGGNVVNINDEKFVTLRTQDVDCVGLCSYSSVSF